MVHLLPVSISSNGFQMKKLDAWSSLKNKLLSIRNEFNYFQVLSVALKGISIISSAVLVPFLVENHGLSGFALFSLAIALVYVIGSIDLGIANVINSTSMHDKKTMEERFRLAAFILALLLVSYLCVVLVARLLASNSLVVFNFFNLSWIMFASYLVILNNLGLKILLINGNVMKYQLVHPMQQISANIFIIFASSRSDLQYILVVYFVISNFAGSLISLYKILIRKGRFHLLENAISFRKNFASLMTFQYLQLLAIFNSQGITLLVSRFFGLEIVAFYSIASRIFQSVNQIYSQLIADYWNRISRLLYSNQKETLYLHYRSQINKSIYFGCLVNGGILLSGPVIIGLFLSVEYDFLLFMSLAFYWTCTLVFMPISHTFNGLLHTQGQIIWQTLFSAVSAVSLILCGLFRFPLSFGILTLSSVLVLLVLPMSNKSLKKLITSSSVFRNPTP